MLNRLKKIIGRQTAADNLFKTLEVEISSPCNLKCVTCPNKDHRRPRQELPMDIIERMVDELVSLGYQGGFSPHFYNEPLLDKRLPDILQLVRGKLPKVTINLFTNFTLMTPELYRRLLPLVDEFIVTADEPEIRAAVEKVTSELQPDELDKLKVRSLEETGLSNRAGALENDEDLLQPKKTCDFVQYMTVDAWGDVHLCCNDYFGKAVFGNVLTRSLADIWFDPKYQQARELGSKAAHPLCRNCFWTE